MLPFFSDPIALQGRFNRSFFRTRMSVINKLNRLEAPGKPRRKSTQTLIWQDFRRHVPFSHDKVTVALVTPASNPSPRLVNQLNEEILNRINRAIPT